MNTPPPPIEVMIIALPETAGSALYGMLDVLLATGTLWEELVGKEEKLQRFKVSIVSEDSKAFTCGNGVPVEPAAGIADMPPSAASSPDTLIIIPELWLGPNEDITGRYPALMNWLREHYKAGASLFSACSGAILLAETGLLDGCPATSHWGYQDLFRNNYPAVRFDPAPTLVIADQGGRIVTAGGTSSWHDLALHIISRYAGPGEALRIAKVYLLKLHDEGQLPYAALVRATPHADAAVRKCQQHIQANFTAQDALAQAVRQNSVPERSLKRRFKKATGMTLIEYLQALRIEEAKRLLEESALPVDEVSTAVGYADFSFFRRLFKRLTGLKPAQYRRLFSLQST